MTANRRIVRAALLCSIALLVGTSNAFAAGRPVRLYAPLPQPLIVSGSCKFDVDVKVIVNNEYVTNFYDANGNLVRQLVTGSLFIALTNLKTGYSITVNISGPGYATFNPDGSFVQRYEGNSAIPLPKKFLLTSGTVDVLYPLKGDPVIQKESGVQQDLCALLSH